MAAYLLPSLLARLDRVGRIFTDLASRDHITATKTTGTTRGCPHFTGYVAGMLSSFNT